MCGILLFLLLSAGDDGWGDEPPVVDGFRRVTEAEVLAQPQLVGQRAYLDGKFGGATREQLQLQASRVPLFLAQRLRETEPLMDYGRDANLRVFGVVTHRYGRTALEIERIDRLPDDPVRYHLVRQQLRDGEPADRYALAERLRARAARYGAERPRTWAREVAREGAEMELEASRHRAAALYTLADRARTLVEDVPFTERILTAALGAERSALPRDQAAPHFQLADKWDRLLPGRAEPTALRREGLLLEEQRLPPGDAEGCYALATRYETLIRDGIRARELRRRGLTLQLAALQPADHEGRYGLSRKIATLVQDQAWARQVLEAGAAIERSRLAGRPPTAYFQLADLYGAQLEAPASRDALLRQGLLVEEQRLDPRDLNGYFELALAYLTSLGDRSAALDRLRHCLALVPGEPRVRAKFAELGLVEINGEWYEKERVQADPKLAWEAEVERAVTSGRVELGMLPRHVLRAFGEPIRRDAVYTSGAVTIQWTYSGAPPVCITFRNGRVVSVSR